LVLERLIPPMKSRVVRFDMPKIESVEDIGRDAGTVGSSQYRRDFH
jgi:hypothetical protein